MKTVVNESQRIVRKDNPAVMLWFDVRARPVLIR